MLGYDRIKVSVGTDVRKTDGLCERIVFHYWYRLNIILVSNGCHDLIEKAMNFNDVAIVTVKGNNYIIHFLYMRRGEVIDLLRNPELTENSRTL